MNSYFYVRQHMRMKGESLLTKLLVQNESFFKKRKVLTSNILKFHNTHFVNRKIPFLWNYQNLFFENWEQNIYKSNRVNPMQLGSFRSFLPWLMNKNINSHHFKNHLVIFYSANYFQSLCVLYSRFLHIFRNGTQRFLSSKPVLVLPNTDVHLVQCFSREYFTHTQHDLW